MKHSIESRYLRAPFWRMGLRERNGRKAAFLGAILIVLLAAKYVQFYFLPGKYFYDSARILNMTLHPDDASAWDGSYRVAASFFRFFRVLGLRTLEEWALLSIGVGLLLLLGFMRDIAEVTWLQGFTLLCLTGLLSIYVLNIGKELIQLLVFSACAWACQSHRLTQGQKCALILAILVLEGLRFRSYYLLVAALSALAYGGMRCVCAAGAGRDTGRIVLRTGLLLWLGIAVGLTVCRQISPEIYQEIFSARAAMNSGRLDSSDAQTMLSACLPGESTGIFVLNTLLNHVRLLLPLELLTRGVRYLPFVVAQLCLTGYLLRRLCDCLQKPELQSTLLPLALMLGYGLCAAFFEPDFGSWVRHETAAFPMWYLLIMQPDMRARPKTEKQIGASRYLWQARCKGG